MPTSASLSPNSASPAAPHEPIAPIAPIEALRWLARQPKNADLGPLTDDGVWVSPAGSATLTAFLDQVPTQRARDTLFDIAVGHYVEFRYADALATDGWAEWFNPLTTGAPCDLDNLLSRMQRGDGNPLIAPIVRITQLGLDHIRADQHRPADPVPSRTPGGTVRKKPGRLKNPEIAKRDIRMAEAMDAGFHKTYRELGNAFQVTAEAARKAVKRGRLLIENRESTQEPKRTSTRTSTRN